MIGKRIKYDKINPKEGSILDKVLSSTVNGGSFTEYLVRGDSGEIILIRPNQILNVYD
jgi:hypothetical protein